MFHSSEGLSYIEYPMRYEEILYKKTDNFELAKETIYKFIKKYLTGELSINLYHEQLYVFIVTKFEIHDRIKTKRENYSNYCKDMHICYGIIKCRENIESDVAILLKHLKENPHYFDPEYSDTWSCDDSNSE